MVEGAVRHGTEMDLEGNYVDSHGQSEIGFGITRLLGFKLLSRIKRINHARLYLPDRDQSGWHSRYRGRGVLGVDRHRTGSAPDPARHPTGSAENIRRRHKPLRNGPQNDSNDALGALGTTGSADASDKRGTSRIRTSPWGPPKPDRARPHRTPANPVANLIAACQGCSYLAPPDSL